MHLFHSLLRTSSVKMKPFPDGGFLLNIETIICMLPILNPEKNEITIDL